MDSFFVEPHGREDVAWRVARRCARGPSGKASHTLSSHDKRLTVDARERQVQDVRSGVALVPVQDEVEAL